MQKWAIAALNAALIGFVVFVVSTPAWAQTATPNVVATPAADASQQTNVLAPDVRGKQWTSAHQFDAGLQIGTTGAAKLTFVALGTCTLNPASSGTLASELVRCAAPGAAVGDYVFVQKADLGVGTNVEALTIGGAAVTIADNVDFLIANPSSGTIDGAAATYNYLVVR